MIYRRNLLLGGAAVLGVTMFGRGFNPFAAAETAKIFEVAKTPEEWRKLLTPQQFAVLREHGTERAGSSPLDNEKRRGTFVCAGCELPLFKSEWKYDSGTGWPSFYTAMKQNIGAKKDLVLLIPRTEYHCARCLGHQGHIFDDGPQPTGLRYCNNGAALRFVAA